MDTTMTEAIRFDGQAAIVTGAGGGIGRAVALELARRGARMLINDVGGNIRGHGGSSAPAEAVAQEIRRAGGTAVANNEAVGTADAARAIVSAALAAFGRVDILANIAGTALPGEITAYDDADVEAQFRINLLGPFTLVRAVWPVMRAQRYGRILNTSSNAAFGLGANATYAATRAGIIGLTMDSALAGRDHGILVNAIMPAAYSRMIQGIPDEAYVAWFRKYLPAEKVAAASAYLLSRHCNINGRILAVGGGRVARVAFVEGAGWIDTDISAESLAENVDVAMNMEPSRVMNFQEDSARLLSDLLAPSTGGMPVLDPHAIATAQRGAHGPSTG